MSEEHPADEPLSVTRHSSPGAGPWRLSLRETFGLITIVALGIGHVVLLHRLTSTERELARLRAEVGYLPSTEAGQIAAVRVPSTEPLTYRVRVRVPDSPPYRIAYSSVMPKGRSGPAWFAAVDLPAGESVVTLRVARDPRDERWKIATLVQSSRGTKRVATVLPPEHVTVFRGVSSAVSAGIGRSAVTASPDASLRLLDERWLTGEGALMLYGDRPPERDQVGIYAELQPDIRPL